MNPIMSYPTIESYYDGRPGRRRSGEADYGVHWTVRGNCTRWRVSYVRNTGEVYAVRRSSDRDTTIVLGTFPADEGAGPADVYYQGLERHLEGWALRCTIPGSLAWVQARMGIPPDPSETTHLMAARNLDGSETTLCGTHTGLIFFLEHIRDQPKRKVACPDCIAIQNTPPDQTKYRASNPEEDHACRCCGYPIHWLSGKPAPNLQEVRNNISAWICEGCGQRKLQNLILPSLVIAEHRPETKELRRNYRSSGQAPEPGPQHQPEG